MTKRDDVVVALLTLADIIVLVVMYPLLPLRATETLAVYIFDVAHERDYGSGLNNATNAATVRLG